MSEIIKVRLLNNGGYGDDLNFPIEVDGFIYDELLIGVCGQELTSVGFTGMRLGKDYVFFIGNECEIV